MAATLTARLIIEIAVRAPSTREQRDVAAILAVEAPAVVGEIFGTVFGDDYRFTSAVVEWRANEEPQ